jgi:hypothetical protein
LSPAACYELLGFREELSPLDFSRHPIMCPPCPRSSTDIGSSHRDACSSP